jgi:hypothetical protein
MGGLKLKHKHKLLEEDHRCNSNFGFSIAEPENGSVVEG